MKLLRARVNGHRFFENDQFDMEFIARDRVAESWEVHHLFGSIYSKSIAAICGVNASGKTTVLEVLRAVTHLFVNGESLRHHIDMEHYKESVSFTVWFYHQQKIYELHSTIRQKAKKLIFEEEVLKEKSQSKGNTRNKLFQFSNKEVIMKRSSEDTRFLPDDISMITSLLKTSDAEALDHMHYTEKNVLFVTGDIPEKFTQLLDPSIEYIRNDKNQSSHICIKFYGKSEMIVDREDLQLYLSSGTVKGLNFLALGYLALQTGGYFIVDEIENHFHKAIVEILLGFFADPEVNLYGASLYFSTHYVEVLESLERKDNIYITRKTASGITIGNLSDEKVRNDMKKSELFLSNRLNGTAPSYERYLALKKELKRNIREDVEEYV